VERHVELCIFVFHADGLQALSKFASIVYASNQFGSNSALATAGLKKLEEAFSLFVNNGQQFPLVYDTVWGGAVSSASYVTKDPGQDFGNTYYNDHHFHYGYFVHAAAVIAYLDPAWLKQGTNKDWVNMLVRDFANGVDTDSFFPVGIFTESRRIIANRIRSFPAASTGITVILGPKGYSRVVMARTKRVALKTHLPIMQ
jgi:hypothetical protein